MPSKPKPRDRRDYVRVTVDLPTNRKLEATDSPHAKWLYVVGLCWAGENLTDGVILPKAVARKAGVPAKWVTALIREGAWHEAGHDCPSCQEPPAGYVVIHDYLEHQRSKDEATKARDSARAAAETRWASKRDAEGNAIRIAKGTADSTAESNAEVKVEVEEELKPLLAMISRLAAGNASLSRPPAESVASWQEVAGPGVDLEAEAREYLARYGDRPAVDERASWLGWLRKGATRRALQAAVSAPVRTPDVTAPPCPVHGTPTARGKGCPACRSEAVPAPATARLRAVAP